MTKRNIIPHMNKVLSISISAYNQERHLDRCIESLIIPSVDELEIFVVNDGSKDRTSEIAHRWAEKYPQSVFAIDKENGHAGSCHNVTLKSATGKYYRILDGDDYYDTEALESFVQKLKHADADMVISTHVICSRHGAERVAPAADICDRELQLTDVDFTRHNLSRCYGMHGTTYRTAILGGVKSA